MNMNFDIFTYKELWQLITVAPTFFGAALTGLIAIAVLFMTNFWNDRRLRIQLENDKELKRYEATQVLRRELYLNATAALYSGLEIVNRISNTEISHGEICKYYDEKSTDIAKIQLVASEPISIAVAEFITELHNTHLGLSVIRNHLVQKNREVDEIRNDAKRYANEYSELIKRKKELYLEGDANLKNMPILDQFLEFAKTGKARRYEDRYQAEVSWYEENLQFKELCSQEEGKLSRLFLKVAIAVRKELELPEINEKRFIEILDQGIQTRNENLTKALAKVKATLKEQAKSRQAEVKLEEAMPS